MKSLRDYIAVGAAVVVVLFIAVFGGMNLNMLQTLPPKFFPTLVPQGTTTIPALNPLETTSTTPIDTAAPTIARVVDGDTIVIHEHGQEVKVRLIGINSPESIDPRRPVQCFGKEASAHLSTLIPVGTAVIIKNDPTQDMYDTYGRLLAYIFLPDGRFINEAQIADGYAFEYTFKNPYQYQKEFKAAEQTARIEQHGLWAPSACNGESKAALQ